MTLDDKSPDMDKVSKRINAAIEVAAAILIGAAFFLCLWQFAIAI